MERTTIIGHPNAIQKVGMQLTATSSGGTNLLLAFCPLMQPPGPAEAIHAVELVSRLLIGERVKRHVPRAEGAMTPGLVALFSVIIALLHRLQSANAQVTHRVVLHPPDP